jgi:hypothetical protein
MFWREFEGGAFKGMIRGLYGQFKDTNDGIRLPDM